MRPVLVRGLLVALLAPTLPALGQDRIERIRAAWHPTEGDLRQVVVLGHRDLATSYTVRILEQGADDVLIEASEVGVIGRGRVPRQLVRAFVDERTLELPPGRSVVLWTSPERGKLELLDPRADQLQGMARAHPGLVLSFMAHVFPGRQVVPLERIHVWPEGPQARDAAVTYPLDGGALLERELVLRGPAAPLATLPAGTRVRVERARLEGKMASLRVAGVAVAVPAPRGELRGELPAQGLRFLPGPAETPVRAPMPALLPWTHPEAGRVLPRATPLEDAQGKAFMVLTQGLPVVVRGRHPDRPERVWVELGGSEGAGGFMGLPERGITLETGAPLRALKGLAGALGGPSEPEQLGGPPEQRGWRPW